MTRAIFITGAASGIGKAVALRFARDGWFVGLADVNESGLAEVAGEIAKAGGGCVQLALDVCDRAAWDSAMTAFGEASGGRLDVFFNNAGIAPSGPFAEMPEAKATALVDVNVQGVVNGLYAALPLLRQTADAHGRARVINTASAAGLFGSPQLATYSATKFFVRGLTEALNLELEAAGILVSDLMPWIIDTPLLDTAAEEGKPDLRERVAQGGTEIYSVDLVVDAVLALANETSPGTVHRPVGKQADRIRFLSRFAPGFLRWNMKRSYGKQ